MFSAFIDAMMLAIRHADEFVFHRIVAVDLQRFRHQPAQNIGSVR